MQAEREAAELAPFVWPEPGGPLSLDMGDELFGGAVLS